MRGTKKPRKIYKGLRNVLHFSTASRSWQEVPVKPQECKALQQTWFSTREGNLEGGCVST